MLARTLFLHSPCQRPPARVVGKHAPPKVTCRAIGGQQADGSLIDTDTLRSLSPEARKVFQAAQENIIEINKGRIRALDELKLAKKRIADLENQLQEALLDATQAAEQVNELKAVAASLASIDVAPAAFVQAPAPPAPMQAAPPTPAPTPEPAPQPSHLVTVLYETSWSTAYLHFNADNKGWTTCPGSRMEEGSGEYAGKKVLKLDCNRVEFVATNGKNDWDHPDQYESGGTKNYVITSPGVYRLKSGTITKVS